MSSSRIQQASFFGDSEPTGAPAVYDIVFDGGSLGNPGRGYGSFAITRNGEEYHPADKAEYPGTLTNNQAEYMTLIRALDWLRDDLGANVARTVTVRVFGDSQLVLKQVTGEWKAKHVNMAALRDDVRRRIPAFGKVTFTWHARSNSVKRLGH